MINFSDIKSSDFQLMHERTAQYGHQDHSRVIYKDNKNRLYYKLWNPGYIRSKTFLQAYHDGYFDLLAPGLVDIIMYDNSCVGYIMHACEKTNNTVTSNFYELLEQETENKKWFYYDWSPNHLMVYNDKLTLIDLESVYPISELQNVLDHKYNCAFRDGQYKKFVWSIYQSMNYTLEV